MRTQGIGEGLVHDKVHTFHENNMSDYEITLCNFCGSEIDGHISTCTNCSTPLKEEDKEKIELENLCKSILEKERKKKKDRLSL